MIAARVLAYGPEYVAEISTPSGQKEEHRFRLTECPFKKLPNDVDYTKQTTFRYNHFVLIPTNILASGTYNIKVLFIMEQYNRDRRMSQPQTSQEQQTKGKIQ